MRKIETVEFEYPVDERPRGCVTPEIAVTLDGSRSRVCLVAIGSMPQMDFLLCSNSKSVLQDL